MTEIIIDECIHSDEIMLLLKNTGVNAKFLGTGLPDIDIERYLIKNPDSLLATSDIEFDTHFSWKKSLLLNHYDSMKEKVILISAFVS
jgi:hypothetical protein